MGKWRATNKGPKKWMEIVVEYDCKDTIALFSTPRLIGIIYDTTDVLNK